MKRKCRTLSVPEAGELYYGICANAAYDAAKRGEIPTIRVGRLWRVPVEAMERIMQQAGSLPAGDKRGAANP